MNPNRGENIQLETIPVPTIGTETSDDVKQEAQPTGQESSPSKQTSAPVLPAIPANMPVAQPPTIPVADDDDQMAKPENSESHTSAHPDRIEKQWVDKAKVIIMQTKDDPFTQKNEMSKFKSEYIKSRFNKSAKSG